MQFLLAFVSALATIASVANAKPIVLERDAANTAVSDIVVAPGFIEPAGGESYPVGSARTAEWDTSSIPAEAQNYTGSLYLGHSDGESSDEHLDISHPLAYGFRLTDGEVNYTIPANATALNSYFLVLVGDSGNKSPSFSITA